MANPLGASRGVPGGVDRANLPASSGSAPRHEFARYTVDTWRGTTCIDRSEVTWSYDAAREICRAHAGAGFTARMMATHPDLDYSEVYDPSGEVRRGTFAKTTRYVRTAAPVPAKES